MRRWLSVLLMGGLMVVPAACIADPRPPSTARITSIVASQDPVVAGTPFTLTVTATDPVAVTRVMLNPADVRPPAPYGSSYDPPLTCNREASFTPAPVITAVFTCTFGTLAVNGTWTFTFLAGGGGDFWSTGGVSFVLTGGSDDKEPPTVVSQTYSPEPVVVGQPFDYTLQVSDDHLADPAPTSLSVSNDFDPADPHPRVDWTCGLVTPRLITPTLAEYDFTGCVIGPDAVLGPYSGFVYIEDQIGNESGVRSGFQVVATP
jgi:hypothetical protein